MTNKELRALVDKQAEDEALWFLTATASEAYLQQELRKLHAAVEALEDEPEPLAVLEGEANAHDVAEIAMQIGAIPFRLHPDPDKPLFAPTETVTVTITERKPF